MTSVLEAITKLPRYVDKDDKDYYNRNRKQILEQKKIYNSRPEVKKRSSEYHKKYYLEHREEIRLQQKEHSKNKKNKKKPTK